jgi:hypothetical protein
VNFEEGFWVFVQRFVRHQKIDRFRILKEVGFRG